MPVPQHVDPKPGDVLVLVGTMKGAFIFRADRDRARWDVGGPYFPGSAVYALAYDGRAGRQRLWAGPHSMHWGALLRSSDDFGRTWTNPESANVKFPEGAGAALQQVWQIAPGRADEPDTLYCGIEPAALFVSRDAGETWSLCEGLWNHPQRARWEPGGGGLCLHTILLDPADLQRIRIAVSTAGMYVSEDGGTSWRPSNQGVRAQFLPDPYPEFGQCVHKVAQSRQRPERMFLQNHWGLYRSDDRGESWIDVANGVPSDFGFAVAIHPENPDSAWIVPLESDLFRCTPEGKLRVYRTRDAGASWQPLGEGLPQHESYQTVLRDALAADPLSPAGVYFGTRSGKVFATADEGEHWTEIADGLPPVVAVKTAVV
ncbi:MAG: exo-alpha-sialidase [Acidobacteria bacterium]|nr:exo-alpha-sialidase [Acidobacteriota bacterium]MBV9476099.1 exo-alpha-sialidase [Acidobacteriota bacterium]